jgi:hypothetical protein
VHIGRAITDTARTTIRIGIRMERPSRIATRDMGMERTNRIATQDTGTHHLGHGPGMDTRTNRGLGPDHPRIRTSSRGGRANGGSRHN